MGKRFIFKHYPYRKYTDRKIAHGRQASSMAGHQGEIGPIAIDELIDIMAS